MMNLISKTNELKNTFDIINEIEKCLKERLVLSDENNNDDNLKRLESLQNLINFHSVFISDNDNCELLIDSARLTSNMTNISNISHERFVANTVEI